MNNNMTDSGRREQFASGAVRDTSEDKPRPDLISPFALQRIGQWLALGAKKYKERNWEAGMPISRCLASLFRHLMQYMMGERSEDHLAAIATNAIFILHFEEMIKRGVLTPGLLDMPLYRPKSALEYKPSEPRKNQHKGNPVVLDGDDEDEEDDDEPEEEDAEEAENACCDCRFYQTSAQDEPCVSCLAEHKYFEPVGELVPSGHLTARQAIQAMRDGQAVRYLGWRPTQWMEYLPDTGFVDEAGIIFDETHLTTYYNSFWVIAERPAPHLSSAEAATNEPVPEVVVEECKDCIHARKTINQSPCRECRNATPDATESYFVDRMPGSQD